MTKPIINTDCIERYMARVRQANTSRSKDLRLSMEEAQELSATMGQLLARLSALQEAASAKQDVISISMDGGAFSN